MFTIEWRWQWTETKTELKMFNFGWEQMFTKQQCPNYPFEAAYNALTI